MEFGIVKRSPRKDNLDTKYPNEPIVSLTVADPEAEKQKLGFELNSKAIEALELNTEDTNCKVGLSFPMGDNKVYIVNTSSEPSTKNTLKVYKNNTFYNKKQWKETRDRFLSNEENELILKLEKTEREFNGYTVFELVYNTKEEPSNEVEETTEVVNETVTQ